MEGNEVRHSSATPGRPAAAHETVLFSYAETARQFAAGLTGTFERQEFACLFDEKLRDPGETVDDNTRRKISQCAMVVFVISRRCPNGAWRHHEALVAAAAGKAVIVFVESLLLNWTGSSPPTLMTDSVERIATFIARSKPDPLSVWEFGKPFFIDRPTAARFRRENDARWRWKRETGTGAGTAGSSTFELSLVDESAASAAKSEVNLIEARAEGGSPVLFIGTTDWKRYRLAYSHAVRAVLPAPVFRGAPVIGFMHTDFDSGREWPRAGEAPVELRLLGREVYGWHMSEYFWRAFVGSLPKMLGNKE